MYALLVHHHNGRTNLKLYQIREFFWAHLCKGEKLTNYTPDNSSHCTVDSPSLLLVHNSHTHLCSECLVMKVHSVTHWYQSTVMLIITVGHYSPDPCSYSQTPVLPSYVYLHQSCLSLDSPQYLFQKIPNLEDSLVMVPSCLFKDPAGAEICSSLQISRCWKNWGVSCTPHWYHCTTKRHTTLC